jgi:hypothetical protein
MKFRVQMKDPDGFYEAVSDAVAQQVNAMPGLSDQEKARLKESRHEDVREKLRTWFEYDEYLTVEVDTEAKTCLVVPRGR